MLVGGEVHLLGGEQDVHDLGKGEYPGAQNRLQSIVLSSVLLQWKYPLSGSSTSQSFARQTETRIKNKKCSSGIS